MGIRWSALKSERLKRIRGVSFEEIIETRVIGIIVHPKIRGQDLMLFERSGYIWVAPCIISEDDVFLKTLYPSRKYTKIWKRGGIYEAY